MKRRFRRLFAFPPSVVFCLILTGAFLGGVTAWLLSSRSETIAITSNAGVRPAMTVPVSLAGVIDDRALFRPIFCALDADHGGQFPTHVPCEHALQRLADEGLSGLPPNAFVTARESPHLHIVIIPGMFGQCVRKWARPLQDAAFYLRSKGYPTDTIDVDGRSSSARNAEIIARTLPSVLRPGERLLLIGYSKGISDILETLASHPQSIPSGSAIVSLAGIVSGTPLVDGSAKRDKAVAEIPLPNCNAGDAGALDSVSRSHRIDWLANHALPRDRTYFSIVAFTGIEHISGPLKATYRALAARDPRNDGQVLYTDAVVPGSHLLAYLNADHWAIALPLARNVPKLRSALGSNNDFPREILLEAIVRSVELQLNQTKTAPRHDRKT